MKRMIVVTLVLSLCVAPYVFASNLIIKSFYPNSYHQILKNNEGKEFTLMFWSITCRPCIKELALISRTKMYENQKFVFVSTDYDQEHEYISEVIKVFMLEQQEHWVIQTGKFEEVISEVDKNWYGEVPRNYFFDEDHNRTRLRTIK